VRAVREIAFDASINSPRYSSDGLRLAFFTTTDNDAENNSPERDCLAWSPSDGQLAYRSCELGVHFLCEIPERLGGFDIWQ